MLENRGKEESGFWVTVLKSTQVAALTDKGAGMRMNLDFLPRRVRHG